MNDPMHCIEHWTVLVASKDAQGWDYYNMSDETKVRYAHSSHLIVTSSAGWYCRIAVIVDQSPRFSKHVDDCRIAARNLSSVKYMGRWRC